MNFIRFVNSIYLFLIFLMFIIVQVNGGFSFLNFGGGGGGRIVVYYRKRIWWRGYMMVRGGFSFGVNGGVGIIYLQVSFNSDYFFWSVQWLIRNQCFLFIYVDGIGRFFFYSYLICFCVMIFFLLDVKFFLGKVLRKKIF